MTLAMNRNRVWVRMWRSDAAVRQGHRCYWCLGRIEPGEATAEHIWPKARGGADAADNIGAAHEECNLARGRLAPRKFKQMLRGTAPIPAEMHPRRREVIRLLGMTYRLHKRADLACKRIARAAR